MPGFHMIATIVAIAEIRRYCSDRGDYDRCSRCDRKISISAIVAIATIKIPQMAFASTDMQIILISELWCLQ